MALINCPECDHNVSKTALKCPSCGHQIRKPKRSCMGKLFKWAFILFNILMIIWLIGGMNAASDVVNTAASDAGRAGATIGRGIGIMMIGTFWVIGDIILGMFVLFTRPKS